MKKKLLRFYILFVFISLSLLIFDGVSNAELGNKCYDLLSFNFRNFFSKFLESHKLEEENKKLLEKIAVLSYEKHLFSELKKENLELKRIIDFKLNYPQKIIPAEIRRETPEEVNLSFRIDKGFTDGIERNDAVISFKGIIGKVLKSGKNTAVVQTLKNYNSAVSVKDTENKVEGILKWNKKFFVEGIPQYADLINGDTIVTSGKGSVFPKGLPVGVVTGVKEKINEYSLEIEIEPFENLDRVSVVFVIKK